MFGDGAAGDLAAPQTLGFPPVTRLAARRTVEPAVVPTRGGSHVHSPPCPVRRDRRCRSPPSTASAADAEDASGTPIVYSDTYRQLITLFPAGSVSNGCWIVRRAERHHRCVYDGVRAALAVPQRNMGRATLDRRSVVADRVVGRARPMRGAFDGTDPEIDWWPLYIAYLDWVTGWTDSRRKASRISRAVLDRHLRLLSDRSASALTRPMTLRPPIAACGRHRRKEHR